MKTISHTPEISIIIVAMNGSNSIRNLLKHLRDQTAADRIEFIILTTPESKLFLPSEEMEPYFCVEVNHVDSELSLGEVKAIGLRLANAPVVVFLEGHVFPEEKFVEALLKAHGNG